MIALTKCPICDKDIEEITTYYEEDHRQVHL